MKKKKRKGLKQKKKERQSDGNPGKPVRTDPDKETKKGRENQSIGTRTNGDTRVEKGTMSIGKST